MTTGFLLSDLFTQHDTGAGHPESPERLKAIANHLQSNQLWENLDHIDLEETSTAEFVSLIHPEQYQRRFHDAVLFGQPIFDSMDNPMSTATFNAASMAVTAMVNGIDAIINGQCKNAFAAVRPPGHHAEESTAMGFCFFNNVAVAARYAQEHHQLDRVAIIDFDVHHGNGTQHIFENDPTVLYVSTHRYSFYPGTGSESEIGTGKGRGFTANYPLSVQTGDEEYIRIVKNEIADKVLSFRPDLLILSAGFDAHELDPLGGMNVSTDGFKIMTRTFLDIAKSTCNGRLFSVLEGGYSLKGLSESVGEHISELMEYTQ